MNRSHRLKRLENTLDDASSLSPSFEKTNFHRIRSNAIEQTGEQLVAGWFLVLV
jgi:hypothetical protein